MTEPISDEALAELDAVPPNPHWHPREIVLAYLKVRRRLTAAETERDRLRKALESIPATLQAMTRRAMERANQAIKEGDDAGEQAAVRETAIIGRVERALKAALAAQPGGPA